MLINETKKESEVSDKEYICVVLRGAVGLAWCCVMLCGAVRCCVVLRDAVQCCAMLRGAAWCCVVLYGAAWHCVVLRGLACGVHCVTLYYILWYVSLYICHANILLWCLLHTCNTKICSCVLLC